MSNEPSIDQIKQSLDIVTVAEMYGELVKNGANYKFKNDPSIVVNQSKQIFSNFNGDITGGSVLDLVMYFEKLDTKAGINRLKELSSLDTYTVDPALQIKRKEEAKAKKQVDFQKLQQWGTAELQSVGIHRPIEYQDKDGNTLHYHVPTELERLFETKTLPADYKQKLDYMFSNLIGWNKHFNCSSIVIKDDIGRIVDLIAYRPQKPQNYDRWDKRTKYIYKNSNNRGENFLYPFRKEVESILFKPTNKDKYVVVGEGIKNGLNALMYSVPYISLESTSSTISTKMINYVSDLEQKGFKLLCIFDGDLSGAKAFLSFIKHYYPHTKDDIDSFVKDKENILLKDKSNYKIVVLNFINFINKNSFEIINFLDFDSEQDFVEYLQSGEAK